MMTLIELEERLRLSIEENVILRKKVFQYAKKIRDLKKWLKECIYDTKQNNVEDRSSYEQGLITSLECVLAKIEELESGKNE